MTEPTEHKAVLHQGGQVKTLGLTITWAGSIAKVERLIELLEPSARQRLFESGDCLDEFFRFETDLVPGRTDKLLVRFEPTQRLLDLLTADGADQWQKWICENAGHAEPLPVDPSDEGSAGQGQEQLS